MTPRPASHFTPEEARELLSGALKGRAEFLKLRPLSKTPAGSFLPGKRNRYKRLPREGNYGILPLGTLFILDVDVHKGGTVRDQVELFSALLGVDLNQTLTVATPSGGRHYYLQLPSEQDRPAGLPKTNLRGFQIEIQKLTGLATLVDADLRSEAANAYIVGPGSELEEGGYELLREKNILSITQQGFENLTSLKGLKAERRKQERAAIDLWEADPLPAPVAGQELSAEVPSAAVLGRLEQALRRGSYETYHQQRAFVKAALHCCYSSDSIALACIALGINRDSSSGNAITRFSLQKDVHSFQPEGSFHGSYCPVGMAQKRGARTILSDEDFQAYLDRLVARRDRRREQPLETLYRRSSPQVLDLERISRALLKDSRRGPRTKQYFAAMAVVEGVLQPLSNVGAEKMLLGQAFLSDTLDLTPSQSSQALRLLRKAGIIEVRDRQKQGFAPTYVVHPRYRHRKLTYYLRRTWLSRRETGSEEPLVYDPRRDGFAGAISGESVVANSLATAIANHQRRLLEGQQLPAPSPVPLQRYLARRRQESAH